MHLSFFDFSKDLYVEENADAYFEVDHETVELNKKSQEVQKKDKKYYHTPPKTTPGNGNNECEATDNKSFSQNSEYRRSKSSP